MEDSPLPTVDLTEFALSGEPSTDRGYTIDGTDPQVRIRVRVRKLDEQKSTAPLATGAAAPTGLTLSVTIALLDEGDQVVTDADGRYIVSNTHSVVIHDLSLENPAFSVGAFLDRVIAEQAFKFQAMRANQASLASVLADWGGGVVDESID